MCCVSTQNTKHYELLNYSEHGTTVDNVLYSCDFSEKASPSPPSGLVAKVQGIIRESALFWVSLILRLIYANLATSTVATFVCQLPTPPISRSQ